MKSTNEIKIVYMGTPYFAQAVLESLIDAKYNIIAVVTQPDKPVGRKLIMEKSPVKYTAEVHQIPVLQPIKIRTDYQEILALKPDIIITCAYGQIIPEIILNSFLCINIHASLLPKLRGGAPMHRAIMNGLDKTGITIMRMAKKMDDGDMIAQAEVAITLDDTVGSLQTKLIISASKLIKEYLPLILAGEVVYIPQDEHLVTFGYNITKEEEFVSFKDPYLVVYNHIRALIPWPVGYGTVDGVKIKLHKAHLSDEITDLDSGYIIGLKDNALAVAVENRVLLIDELQIEGRNKINAKDFVNGSGKKLINKLFM